MNKLTAAARSGWARGLIEFRQLFTTPQDLVAYLLPNVIFMVAMAFLRAVPPDRPAGSSWSLCLWSVCSPPCRWAPCSAPCSPTRG